MVDPKPVHISALRVSAANEALLSDVALSIGNASRIAIIGPSGAGKSTLGRCLSGTLPTSLAFSADVDGQLITSASLADWSRRVGPIVFASQSPHRVLPPLMSAADLVAATLSWQGMPGAGLSALEVAKDLLDGVGFPANPALRTMPSSALSGGMARRALLGAVLACNARALFLDEPTAGLDPEAIGVLIETLTTLPSLNKLGLLIATHDLEFAAQLCDEFILLSCGTVAAHGELKGTPDARAEHLLAAFEASDPCFGSRRPS